MSEEKFVDVNGFQVMDLTPDMHRALALVDLEVLVKLTSYLETANVYTISSSLREEIRDAANKDNKEALQAMVHICAEFVAFHKTVNLIKEVKHPMNEKAVVKPDPIRGKDISDIS